VPSVSKFTSVFKVFLTGSILLKPKLQILIGSQRTCKKMQIYRSALRRTACGPKIPTCIKSKRSDTSG